MKILLAVDLQKQFKDKDGQYEKCLEYIEKHRKDYDKVVATLFKQDRAVNGNFRKLNYDDCMDADISDIEFKTDYIIVKHGYGLPTGTFGDEKITVIGCDADACVLAVCFNLWDDGVDFTVLKDYVYTTGDIPRDVIFSIYKRNFGTKSKGFWSVIKNYIKRKK